MTITTIFSIPFTLHPPRWSLPGRVTWPRRKRNPELERCQYGSPNAAAFYGNVGGSGGSALDDINPEDIESIEIIKGPEAAKLYGTGHRRG
ncbi:MAG: TonB-dependent receptor plug domain-containing protein [Gemmatimonadetes bacterium]|nr:TonB-dependent receptor plug domain-containing protein [Gemmatimonadota bacterium]